MSAIADAPVALETMVQVLDLNEITFYEVASRLDELPAQETEPASTSEDNELNVNWRVRIRHQDLEFGVRLRVEVRNELGVCIVDLAAEYSSASRITVARETVTEFVNNVALMQLYPYIRESIMGSAAKTMRVTLLMPVFQRGELVLELGDGPEFSTGVIQRASDQ